jgi:hypothetical protein
MDYSLTRVDSCTNISAADFWLTGARWLAGGESYAVVPLKGSRDQKFHVIRTNTSAQLLDIIKRIIGFVLVLLILPTVIGYALKTCDERAKERYFMMKTYLVEKPMLAGEYFSKAPTPMPISEFFVSGDSEDQNSIQGNLLIMWGQVSDNNKKVESGIREVCRRIWGSGSLAHVTNDQRAKTYLKNGLALLIDKLPEKSDDERRQILKEISEMHNHCPPTWVEILTKLIRKVIVADQATQERDRFLGFVQTYKEELVLQYVQKINPSQWHGINYARRLVGAEFGLDQSSDHHDGAARGNGFSADAIRQFLYEKLVLFQFVHGVTNAIHSEMEAANRHSTVPGIDSLVMSAAKLYAQKAYGKSLQEVLKDKKLPFSDHNVDPYYGFLTTHFYKELKAKDKHGIPHIAITETAVLCIFLALGLIDPLPIHCSANFSDIYKIEIKEEAKRQARGVKSVTAEELEEQYA